MFFCSFNDEQQKVEGEQMIIELKEYNLLRENLNLKFDLCAQEKKKLGPHKVTFQGWYELYRFGVH